MKTRVSALLLSLVMTTTMMPMQSMAAETVTENEIAVVEESETEAEEQIALYADDDKTGKCGDNLTWTLTQNEGTNTYTLTITGSGAMYNYDNGESPGWYDYVSSITEISLPDGLTSIGVYSFFWCDALTSVSIPATVTIIDDDAFQNCLSLTSITISSGVMSIGENAFAGCMDLESVTFKGSAPTISETAFFLVNNATCYYPSGDSSWDTVANLDYSGTLKWESKGFIANSGTCGGSLSWTLTQNNEDTDKPTYTLDIRGSGAMYDYNPVNSYSPSWETYKSNVTVVFLHDGITSIGNYAFYECTSLKVVAIPNGVTSIGDYAFQSCTGLTSMTIPNDLTSIGDYAFQSCKGLTSMTIPNNVTSIGDYAFQSCTGLTNITISLSVTSIGEYAFNSCTALKNVTFNGNAPKIAGTAFGGVIATCSYPAQNSSWNIVANQNYGGTLTWESYVPVVDSGYCGVDLTWILTQNNEDFDNPTYILTIIGNGAMYDYNEGHLAWQNYIGSITEVLLPDGLTSIGNRAFMQCASLTSVEIPSSVTSIGAGAFRQCSSLTSVTIPANVTSIGDYAFYGCTGLTSITIPTGVTSIGIYAFYGCTGLTSITIPTSVTSIGIYAFYGCTSLTSIMIPTGVTSIGESAFDSCISLTSIMIPSSVTFIGGKAFNECNRLDSVTFEGEAPEIADNAFYHVKAICSYPIGGGGWNTVANNNYGGTLTWKSYEPVVASGQCGGELKWVLTRNNEDDVSTYTLTITGDGAMYDYSEENLGWHNYVSSITVVSLPDGLTSIGDNAFIQCSSLTSVVIPANVKSIGASAFQECSSLTSITIPTGVTSIGDCAFDDCSNLTRVTFDGNAPEIADNAFDDVTATCSYPAHDSSWNTVANNNYGGTLTWESYVPVVACGSCGDNLTWTITQNNEDNNTPTYALSITGNGAMHDYENENLPWQGFIGSITAVSLLDGLTSIGDHAFDGCTGLTSITIPTSVTNIGIYAFYGCTGLTSIMIPNGVTSIGDFAFYSCTGLTSISIASSVTSIGDHAFEECTDLTSITIPTGVTSISEGAFDGCTGLTSITIPTSVTSIGDSAFYGCTGLTSIMIPNGVTSIGDYAFNRCTGLTNISIASSVTSIGDHAFQDCTDLTSIMIPTGVTSIGDHAFEGCRGLINITIPTSVTSIGNYAFGGCTGLTSITIPTSVTSIGIWAFKRNYSLQSVTFEGNAPTISESAFSNVTAICYYSETNSSWDEIVTANNQYGGSLIWVGHMFTTTDAKEATCTEAGNMAYYTCSVCGKYYSNEKGTSEIAKDRWIIAAKGHKLTKVSAAPATVSTAGNTEYWQCDVCKKLFADAQGTKEISAENIIIQKLTEGSITASDVVKIYSAKAQSFNLGATSLGSGALAYKSNNAKVTVNSTGKITVKAKFIGQAKITISAAADSTYAAASKTITVTVNPTKTTLSSVKNSAAKKVTVKWKKNKIGTGYQIQYSLKKNFASSVKTKTVNKNKTTSLTIKSLKKGKTYYVRIRTYKTVSGTKYCSDWSKVKKVKIKK